MVQPQSSAGTSTSKGYIVVWDQDTLWTVDRHPLFSGNLQANLFDVANSKLVRAASLETSEPGKVLAISREVARLVIQCRD